MGLSLDSFISLLKQLMIILKLCIRFHFENSLNFRLAIIYSLSGCLLHEKNFNPHLWFIKQTSVVVWMWKVRSRMNVWIEFHLFAFFNEFIKFWFLCRKWRLQQNSAAKVSRTLLKQLTLDRIRRSFHHSTHCKWWIEGWIRCQTHQDCVCKISLVLAGTTTHLTAPYQRVNPIQMITCIIITTTIIFTMALRSASRRRSQIWCHPRALVQSAVGCQQDWAIYITAHILICQVIIITIILHRRTRHRFSTSR